MELNGQDLIYLEKQMTYNVEACEVTAIESRLNAIIEVKNYLLGILEEVIKAKLIVEVEAEFCDNESSEETLRYCVEQDLEDAGFNVIDVSVMK